jgi:uncharacterized membrane protein YcjF (UPF0283 family)
MAPPPTPPQPNGYLASLLDLRFTSLVTPRLIKGLYLLILIATSLTVLMWVWAGFYLPEWMGWGVKVMAVIGIPIAGLVVITFARMALEYMIVQFAIRDELRAVRINLERLNANTKGDRTP